MGSVSEFQALIRDSLTSTTVTCISGHIWAITLQVGPPTYPAPMQQIFFIWNIWKVKSNVNANLRPMFSGQFAIFSLPTRQGWGSPRRYHELYREARNKTLKNEWRHSFKQLSQISHCSFARWLDPGRSFATAIRNHDQDQQAKLPSRFQKTLNLRFRCPNTWCYQKAIV